MIIVVMGVSGSGKSTIGPLLADALDCTFLDADALHPAANVEKMRRAIPLSDVDRAPWLAAVRAHILDAHAHGKRLVVACSALREAYRTFLADGVRVTWVFLAGTEELIRQRLQRRTDHFMPAALLGSQLHGLEEPSGAIVADASKPPHAIVHEILAALSAAPGVRVLDDIEALSLAVAEAIVTTIARVVRDAGECSLVLSGGSTPRTIHRLLATRFADRVPWSAVHAYWGDERYVPPEHAASNYGMARETLLDHVPIPPANVHPMPTDLADPEAAARAYEETLRRNFRGRWPRFDLVLLGIGSDGHTASLFPGSPALAESRRWVAAATAPADPPSRLTLTLPALRHAARTYFVVAGAGKADAVRCVLTGAAGPDRFPAAAIQRPGNEVTWWLDGEAAAAYAQHTEE